MVTSKRELNNSIGNLERKFMQAQLRGGISEQKLSEKENQSLISKVEGPVKFKV